ncbi:MAG TPA: hypothetical protein DDY77_06310 [Clostridiales bacterium]|nr:hypothetical protein [Clostridiales bacterium]
MIGVYLGKNDKETFSAAEKLISALISSGFTVEKKLSDESSRFSESLEFIIVFGGDGSVLKAITLSNDKTPVVAINTGNLGFLTSYNGDETEKLIADVKNNNLKFSKRALIDVITKDGTFSALNDAFVLKDFNADKAGGCVRLSLRVGGEYVDGYVADGLIVSTPTGSTAYALSAGGPVITPTLKCLEAVPVCAHSLHARPIVFPASEEVKITVDELSKPCAVYADGALISSLNAGESVIIKESGKTADICFANDKFFDKLNKKLNYWSTTGEDDGKK